MAATPPRREFQARSAVQIIDAAVALFRTNARPLLRQLVLLLGSVALLKLLSLPNQPQQWAALSPLQTQLLLDASALLIAGVPLGEVFAQYGAPIVYHILIWIVLASILLPILTNAATAGHGPAFSGASALGALTVIPLMLLTVAWAGLLRDLGLVVGAWLSGSGLQLDALVAPIVITHAPNIALGIASVLLVVPLLLAAPAAQLEGLGSLASLRRSIGLSRRGRGRILWVALLTSLLCAVFVALPTTAVALVDDPLGGTLSLALPGAVASVLAQCAEALAVPLQLAVVVVLYIDQRVRREGYDLSLRALAVPDDAPLPILPEVQ